MYAIRSYYADREPARPQEESGVGDRVVGVQDIQDLTLFASGVEPNAAGDYNAEGMEREIWNYNYMQIRGTCNVSAFGDPRPFVEIGQLCLFVHGEFGAAMGDVQAMT